jgi:hypothetical protein
MSSNQIYWPFNRVEPTSVGPGLRRFITKFFAQHDLLFEDYRRINDAKFNRRSKAQSVLAEFHAKLQTRLGFGIFALAMVNEGIDPGSCVHDRHYGEGLVWLLPSILDMDLPSVVLTNPGSDVVCLIQPYSTELHQLAITWLDSPPDSRQFSFQHERYTRVLRSLAYTQGATNLLSTPREGLDEACVATFALGGLPSVQTLAAGAQSVMSFKAVIKGREKTISRGYELDYVMSLVNTCYYWILTGADVVTSTQELKRRLDVILPILFPSIAPTLHAVQVRNLLGHVLVHYPQCWPAFNFEAKELLGPSILELHEHWHNDDCHFAGVFDGFLSRSSGVDAQKAATKTVLKKHPELRDPLNVCRPGSRSSVWSAMDGDYTAAASLLNELAEKDIYHHVLKGTVSIDLMSEDNSLKAVMTYLAGGGNANADGAKAALVQYPTLIDRVLPTLSNKKPTERLASICSLTPAQIATLPLVLRGVVFSIDLGL